MAVPQRVSYLNCSLLVARARRHSQIERGLCSVIETLAFKLWRLQRHPSRLKPAPNPTIDSSHRPRPAPERSPARGKQMPRRRRPRLRHGRLPLTPSPRRPGLRRDTAPATRPRHGRRRRAPRKEHTINAIITSRYRVDDDSDSIIVSPSSPARGRARPDHTRASGAGSPRSKCGAPSPARSRTSRRARRTRGTTWRNGSC